MKQSLAAVALVLAAGSFAFADQPPVAHPAPARVIAAAQLAVRLNLSDQQKAQIKAIHQRNRQANQQRRAELRVKHRELAQLRRSGDPRAEDVRAQLMAARQQARATKIATRQEIRALLTSEQRQQLDQIRAERKRQQQK
jgi:Spy/CpxP family protein refolding chaperone